MENTLLLIQINSRFLQSSLSISYLKNYIDKFDICSVEILECSLKYSSNDILEKIVSIDPKVVGFSCYIWNIELTLKVISMIKIVLPECKIICGGPEVSFKDKELIENTDIDFIVRGEGEKCIVSILKNLFLNEELENKEFITYKLNNKYNFAQKYFEENDLDSIPSPFLNKVYSLDKPFVYIETSRGCPYNCYYCSSSNTTKVRSYNMKRIKDDILNLINIPNVKTIRFIDRTFNFNEKRALEIIEFIKKNNKDKVFQMEIKPDIVTDKFMNAFKCEDSKYFHFEIGVQSTNLETLKAVNRVQNISKTLKFIKFMKNETNVHLHVDLIAGLPLENYESFLNSLDDIAFCKPQTIQLGILKILSGCIMKRNVKKYNIKYDINPPYQVLSTDNISYLEMLKLSKMEKLINLIYNDQLAYYFSWNAINLIYKSFSKLFEVLYNFWIENNISFHSNSRKSIYLLLVKFIEEIKVDIEIKEFLKESLVYDFFITAKTNEQFPVLVKKNIKKVNKFKDPLKNDNYLLSINRHLKKKSFKFNIKKSVDNNEIVKYKNEKLIYFDNTFNISKTFTEKELELIVFLKERVTMKELKEKFDVEFIKECFNKGIIS